MVGMDRMDDFLLGAFSSRSERAENIYTKVAVVTANIIQKFAIFTSLGYPALR
jgi:hypothetical protein